MVHVNEVTKLMDQMMKVNIFHPSEKLRMVRDEEKTFLDPNVIMDARHRILRENLSASPVNGSILAEAKKLLTEEETKQLYMKKQQRFLERELKRFEMELSKSRPKFSESYACKKRNFAPSDDENFWRTTRKLRKKMITEKREQIGSHRERNVDLIRKKLAEMEKEETSLKEEPEKNWRKMECEIPCVGSIKVTIKDKINFEPETQRLCVLRKYFDLLKRNAEEKRRLRDIKVKIQHNVVSKIMRKHFEMWRAYAKDAKNNIREQKEQREISEERRIEMFINVITERQKELTRSRKPKLRDIEPAIIESNNETARKKSTCFKRIIVESPAECRLNAQKRIIEKQKLKLAEQNRIIEELKLKQIEEEISRANKETVDIAKGTLTHCGQKTRRTLIQLMQQNGYRDESLKVPRRPPDPPKFLLRVEARAEARRKRVKLAEESRRQKLEEQKKGEEAVRMEEEQKKRRLQQEALIEARRLRKEQEENRQREIEKFRRLNNIADKFYREHLLKRYILEPLNMLIEEKRTNIKKADDHYKEKLMKKTFMAWKEDAEIQSRIKVEIAELFYNRNLRTKMFIEWKQIAKEANLKYQVAIDFDDMRLLDKYFKLWQVTTLELKVDYEEKQKLANNIYEIKLKRRYLDIWKKYLVIAADIKESEKRKNELRQLVQTVIPDFDPKQRGVALLD